MATLGNPNMQGSQVSIFVGAVDPTSGLNIGQPEVKLLGEIDVPSLTIGEGGQRSLSYTAVSVFARLFETDEGARAQDARSEENTSEIQSLMSIAEAVFC